MDDAVIAMHPTIRAEGERLPQHMTIVMERQRRKVQASIDLVSAQSEY